MQPKVIKETVSILAPANTTKHNESSPAIKTGTEILSQDPEISQIFCDQYRVIDFMNEHTCDI